MIAKECERIKLTMNQAWYIFGVGDYVGKKSAFEKAAFASEDDKLWVLTKLYYDVLTPLSNRLREELGIGDKVIALHNIQEPEIIVFDCPASKINYDNRNAFKDEEGKYYLCLDEEQEGKEWDK